MVRSNDNLDKLRRRQIVLYIVQLFYRKPLYCHNPNVFDLLFHGTVKSTYAQR